MKYGAVCSARITEDDGTEIRRMIHEVTKCVALRAVHENRISSTIILEEVHMDNKTLEQMKKLVAEKNLKSSQQGGPHKATQKIGEKRKGIKRRKVGGMFDK